MACREVDRRDDKARAWVSEAIRRVEADANRSADTHLHVFPMPPVPGVDLYLKDESVHPTGWLKHRLARSLFLYALCNGWIREGTTLIEASSGSTAVSEAYFARLLGLPFVAVMPASTSKEKIELIEFYGGRCHFVERLRPDLRRGRAAGRRDRRALHGPVHLRRAGDRLARQQQHRRVDLRAAGARAAPGPDLDRGRRRHRRHSATIGRYVRYQRHDTPWRVVDPENSAFFPAFETGDGDFATGRPSRIEGIGRPRVEPTFVPGVVDRMIAVPDAASIAAMRCCSRVTGRLVGGSTGTNLWGALRLVAEMRRTGDGAAS